MPTTQNAPLDMMLDELDRDITRAAQAVNPWTAPDGLCAGLESGAQAVTALRAVRDALGQLEPGAALTVLDALERGLAVPA